MKLSTAFGIFAQSLVVSSSEVWANQEVQIDALSSLGRQQKFHSIQQLLSKNKRGQTTKQRSRNIAKLKLSGRRLSSTIRSKELKNMLPGHQQADNHSQDCDVGILDNCQAGHACVEGKCVPVHSHARQGFGNGASNYADVVCNPDSPNFYEDAFGPDGYYDCDCSDVDLETGLGTSTCTKDESCLASPYENYCYSLSATLEFTDAQAVNINECYSFTSPSTLEYCVASDTAYTYCEININGTPCNTCTPVDPDSNLCPYPYEDSIISMFDCTNVGSPYSAGDQCFAGDYASPLIQNFQQALEPPLDLVALCENAMTDPAYSCDCSSVDYATNTGTISCEYGNVCYGPYCYSLLLDATVSDLQTYSARLCYDFTEPVMESYCYGVASADPEECTLTLNGIDCNSCSTAYSVDSCTIGPLAGMFDCTNAGSIAGDGCAGEYASTIFEGLINFTMDLTEDTLNNLVMAIFGIDDLSGADRAVWIDLTEIWIESYFNELYPELGVSNLSVDIKVVDVLPADRRQRRELHQEDDFVSVVFNQENRFLLDADNMIKRLSDLATLPFSTHELREDFTNLLQDAGLTDVTGVSEVFVPRFKKAKKAKKSKKAKSVKSSKSSKSNKKQKGKGKGKGNGQHEYSKKTKLEERKGYGYSYGERRARRAKRLSRLG